METRFSKTLDQRDYHTFEEIKFFESMKGLLSGTFYPCDAHHDWKYGLCLCALRENNAISILEVGGAGSLFAACAAWIGMEVTVVDPSTIGTQLFAVQNMILQMGKAPITFKQMDFFQYHNRKKFDAVVCFNTLEYVQEDEAFFKKMLNSVKEEGIFFMNVDFHPSTLKFQSDSIRTYNKERLEAFIAIAKKSGFEVLGGEPDYAWKGENAPNYTFATLALKRKKKQEMPVVLFINNQKRQRDGVYQYGKRVGINLHGSKKYRYIYLEIDSETAFWEHVEEYKPIGIIYNLQCYKTNMPWLNPAILDANRSKGIVQLTMYHDLPLQRGFDYFISTYPNFPENDIVFPSPRPLFKYENKFPISEIPIINCCGFVGDHDYVKLAKLVNQEFDTAIINFHISYNDLGDNACPTVVAKACRSAITKKNIQAHFTHAFIPETELLDFLAKGNLNVFLYNNRKARGGASTLDFALSVKRPIAIAKSHAMSYFFDVTPSICVEDRSLKEIMASGFDPLEPFYEKWKAERFVETYDNIMEKVL